MLRKCLQWTFCFLIVYNYTLFSSENSENSDSSDYCEDLETLRTFIESIKNEEQDNLQKELIKKFVKKISYIPLDVYVGLLSKNELFSGDKSSILKSIDSFMEDGLSFYDDWSLLKNFYANYGQNDITINAIELAFDAISARLNYESVEEKEKALFENQLKELFFSKKLDDKNLNSIYNYFVIFFKERLILKFGSQAAVTFSHSDEKFFSLITSPLDKNINCLQLLKLLIENTNTHESLDQSARITWQTLKANVSQKKKYSSPFRSLRTIIDNKSIMSLEVLPHFSKLGFNNFLRSFGLEFDEKIDEKIYLKKEYKIKSNYPIRDQPISLEFALPDWILLSGAQDLLPFSYAVRSYQNILDYFKTISITAYRDLINDINIMPEMIFNPISKISLQNELIEIWLRSHEVPLDELLGFFPESSPIIKDIQIDIEQFEGSPTGPKITSSKKKKNKDKKKIKTTTQKLKIKENKADTQPKKIASTSSQPKPNNKNKTSTQKLKIEKAKADTQPKKIASTSSQPKQDNKKKAPTRRKKKRGNKKNKSEKEVSSSLSPSLMPTESDALVQLQEPQNIESKPSEDSSTQTLMLRTKSPRVIAAPKIRQRFQAVKNSLSINNDLVNWYNSIRASTMAIFHGPHIMSYLPWLAHANSRSFDIIYNNFLKTKDPEQADHIIQINREAEKRNRLLIEHALREKSRIESMIQRQ